VPYRNDIALGRLVGGATLAGMALALVWSLAIATPAYVSRTEVLVQPAGTPAFEGGGGRGTAVNPGHERELVHSGGVAQLVKERLGTTATVSELGRRVGVTVVGGTRILDLTFQAPTPAEARRGAEAYAAAYLELKRRQVEAIRNEQRAAIHSALEPIEEDLSSARRRLGAVPPATGAGAAAQAQVDDLSAQADPYHQNLAQTEMVDPGDVGTVVSPATTPGRPVRPRPLLDALLGAVAGLGVGAALAFGRARVDRRLQGRADLEEHLGAPVLATVPRVKRRRAGAAPVTVDQPDSRTTDAYRALRIRLLALARTRPLRTVLVAGPAGETGSTAVAANLAASLAEAGKEVTLLASGTAAAAAAGSLPPEEMRDLLAELGEGSDLVVVEGPGMLDTAEGLALAPMVDAVLVVAAVRSTTRDDVVLARQQLDQVGADVVGGVLSNARTPGPI
jgi:capsular polysaccharide biosynthesis protein